jgi:hypothetical protein
LTYLRYLFRQPSRLTAHVAHHQISILKGITQIASITPSTPNSSQASSSKRLPPPNLTRPRQTMQKYDPVPPYNLDDDVEATAAEPESQTPIPSSSSPNQSDPVQLQSSETNVVDPHRPRSDKLTERECCEYAFMYFATCILGLVLMTLIVAYFNYLGRKK